MNKFVAIDTETGGFEHQAETHAILSLAAVPSWDFEPFHILIQPDGLIDEQAAVTNGYTPEAWANAVPIKFALIAFQQWLDASGAHMVNAQPLAHNAGFDRFWLRHRQRREGIDLGLTHRWRCSQAAMGLALDLGVVNAINTSLNTLGELAGLWLPGLRPTPHNALADAKASLQGYLWLIKKIKKGGAVLDCLRRYHALASVGGAETAEWVEAVKTAAGVLNLIEQEDA